MYDFYFYSFQNKKKRWWLHSEKGDCVFQAVPGGVGGKKLSQCQGKKKKKKKSAYAISIAIIIIIIIIYGHHHDADRGSTSRVKS